MSTVKKVTAPRVAKKKTTPSKNVAPKKRGDGQRVSSPAIHASGPFSEFKYFPPIFKDGRLFEHFRADGTPLPKSPSSF